MRVSVSFCPHSSWSPLGHFLSRSVEIADTLGLNCGLCKLCALYYLPTYIIHIPFVHQYIVLLGVWYYHGSPNKHSCWHDTLFRHSILFMLHFKILATGVHIVFALPSFLSVRVFGSFEIQYLLCTHTIRQKIARLSESLYCSWLFGG